MNSMPAVTHIRWDVYKFSNRWWNRYEVKAFIFSPAASGNLSKHPQEVHLGKTATLRGALRIIRCDRKDRQAEFTKELVYHEHLEPGEDDDA